MTIITTKMMAIAAAAPPPMAATLTPVLPSGSLDGNSSVVPA